MTRQQRSDLFFKLFLAVAVGYFVGHIILFLVRL
jgi:hypothetical protein